MIPPGSDGQSQPWPPNRRVDHANADQPRESIRHDDAGRAITPLRWRSLRQLRKGQDPFLRAIGRRLHMAIMREPRPYPVLASLMTKGLGLFLLFACVMVVTMFGEFGCCAGVAFGMAAWVGVEQVDAIGKHKQAAARIVPSALAEGLCGQCCETLRGVAAVEGMISCPACQAQWRADRFQQPTFRVARTTCRQCQYDLSGVPRISPEVVLCPECGAHNAMATQLNQSFLDWAESVRSDLMIADDRGRTTYTCGSLLTDLVPPGKLPQPEGPLREAILRETRRPGLKTRVLWIVLLSAVTTALLVSYLIHRDHHGPNRFPITLALVIYASVVGVGGWALWNSEIGDDPPATARALIRHGHCGACGQRINDEPIAEDGCRICAACGAAWRS
jgi:hypothetical protein